MENYFPTQNEMLLEWLQSGKKITQLEAFTKLGIGALPRRIMDLKEQGHKIEITTIPVSKANGKTAYVSQYKIINRDTNLFGEPINENL